ncbi:Fur family transcriptional regulator [Acholeplasma hippikon]|nr:Fur family transcriptional regulator [Acholeplasma hippikon]
MVKLTSKRQLIYDILKKNDSPLSAEDIYELIKDEKLNLSTVYRTLDYFYKEQMVSRNYLDNKAYFYLNHDDHHHFMICEVCQNRFEMDCHIDEMIAEIKKKYGFEVTHHDLNFYGICSNCKNKN